MNCDGVRYLKKGEKGFTLIEMALVILIMSITLTALIPLYLTYLQQKQMIVMEKKISTIRAALVDFIVDDPLDTVPSEVRYPCPASRTARREEATFGEEQCLVGVAPGNCSNGVCVATGSDGQRVLIGTIPTRALDIPSSIMFDPYGNRFTYAVSAALTVPNSMASLTNKGNITIKDESLVAASPDPTVTQTAQFALISHGSDELGAYSVNGNLKAPCRGVNQGDAVNCNDDGIFSDSLGHSMGENSKFYDDSLAFTLADDNDDQYWRATSASGTNIVNRNPLNVAIGFITGEPTQKLDVNGSIRSRSNVIADANVTAGNSVSAGVDVVASSNVRAGGNVDAGVNVTAGANVTAGQNVSANLDATAGRDVTAGNNVAASNDVTANNNVRAQKNIYAGENFYGKHFFYSDVPSGGSGPSGSGVLLTALCPTGQVLQAIQNDQPLCVPAGGGGAVANFNCPTQQYVAGFGADGNPICKGFLDNGNIKVFACGYVQDIHNENPLGEPGWRKADPSCSVTPRDIAAACIEPSPSRDTVLENYPTNYGGNIPMDLFNDVCVKRFCVNRGFQNGSWGEGYISWVRPDNSAVAATTADEFGRSAFEVRCTAL